MTAHAIGQIAWVFLAVYIDMFARYLVFNLKAISICLI